MLKMSASKNVFIDVQTVIGISVHAHPYLQVMVYVSPSLGLRVSHIKSIYLHLKLCGGVRVVCCVNICCVCVYVCVCE